jgi:hypothetical protein
VDFLPRGDTIKLNAAHCRNMLDRMTEDDQRKRPGWFNHGVVILQDNVTPHTVWMTKQWFEQYGWKGQLHPLHSPNLAPAYFHLFGHPKRSSFKQQFQTDKNVDAEDQKAFTHLIWISLLRDLIHHFPAATSASIKMVIM